MDDKRNMGEQPLAELMRELKLSPAQLVKASTEQLNHKMVSRAAKGRRLTGNVMKKIRQAVCAASGGSYEMKDLFNYKPISTSGSTEATEQKLED